MDAEGQAHSVPSTLLWQAVKRWCQKGRLVKTAEVGTALLRFVEHDESLGGRGKKGIALTAPSFL